MGKLTTVLDVAGIAAVIAGVALISTPAALIAAGALLLVLSWWLSR
jgi:hypothetical protein